MTKKDFEVIAEIIKMDLPWQLSESVAKIFSVELLKRFPRFDQDTFLAACGFPTTALAKNNGPGHGEGEKNSIQGRVGTSTRCPACGKIHYMIAGDGTRRLKCLSCYQVYYASLTAAALDRIEGKEMNEQTG
jgi:hypothetical protein